MAAGARTTVVCLGDSNTAPAPDLPRTSWCDIVAETTRWHVVNRAVVGATMTDFTCVPGHETCARHQLAVALLEDHADVVVLAFGTNDLLFGATLDDVVATARALRAQAEAAGARPLIALTPPIRRFVDLDRRRIALDRALRSALPHRVVLDFTAGMRARDFLPDGIHLSDRGQRKLARQVRRALRSR